MTGTMRCYKGSKIPNCEVEMFGISHLAQIDFLENINLPDKFGRDRKTRGIIWQRIKGQLESETDCHKKDDIIYVVYNIDEYEKIFLCFAIGNGKQNTLQQIFLQASKDFEEDRNTKWDLSNENISIKDHLSALLEGKEVINRFSENQSKQIIYNLLTKDIIRLVNNNKWQEAIVALASNLNKYNDIIRNYTSIERLNIVEYLKKLQEEIKKPEFLRKLRKVKEYDNLIEIGVLR